MTENETPLKLCRKWGEMAPGCFDTLDVLCKESHEEMRVSEVCDLPIGAAYEYLRVKCHLGHWHHYWTGSKSEPEQRKLILKWTHPMLIGGYTDNVVTMFPVKE